MAGKSGYRESTMVNIILCTKVIHLVAMATWFGPKLAVPADIRRCIAQGPAGLQAMLPRLNLVQKITIAAALITLFSGLAMVFLYGGFGAVSPRIHIGLGLTLAIFGLGAFGVDRVWKRMRDIIVSGKDLEKLPQLERSLSRLMFAENVVWTAVLVLMVFRFV
jgi:hypothetical protein